MVVSLSWKQSIFEWNLGNQMSLSGARTRTDDVHTIELKIFSKHIEKSH